MYRVHTLFHTLSVSIVRFVVVKHNGLVSFLKSTLMCGSVKVLCTACDLAILKCMYMCLQVKAIYSSVLLHHPLHTHHFSYYACMVHVVQRHLWVNKRRTYVLIFAIFCT